MRPYEASFLHKRISIPQGKREGRAEEGSLSEFRARGQCHGSVTASMCRTLEGTMGRRSGRDLHNAPRVCSWLPNRTWSGRDLDNAPRVCSWLPNHTWSDRDLDNAPRGCSWLTRTCTGESDVWPGTVQPKSSTLNQPRDDTEWGRDQVWPARVRGTFERPRISTVIPEDQALVVGLN